MNSDLEKGELIMCNDVVYESWIVDECGDTVYKCSWFNDDNEMDEYLEEHPEYRVETRPVYM